jgi:hypothetical protein
VISGSTTAAFHKTHLAFLTRRGARPRVVARCRVLKAMVMRFLVTLALVVVLVVLFCGPWLAVPKSESSTDFEEDYPIALKYRQVCLKQLEESYLFPPFHFLLGGIEQLELQELLDRVAFPNTMRVDAFISMQC